jgi:hypothetical protein
MAYMLCPLNKDIISQTEGNVYLLIIALCICLIFFLLPCCLLSPAPACANFYSENRMPPAAYQAQSKAIMRIAWQDST